MLHSRAEENPGDVNLQLIAFLAGVLPVERGSEDLALTRKHQEHGTLRYVRYQRAALNSNGKHIAPRREGTGGGRLRVHEESCPSRRAVTTFLRGQRHGPGVYSSFPAHDSCVHTWNREQEQSGRSVLDSPVSPLINRTTGNENKARQCEPTNSV